MTLSPRAIGRWIQWLALAAAVAAVAVAVAFGRSYGGMDGGMAVVAVALDAAAIAIGPKSAAIALAILRLAVSCLPVLLVFSFAPVGDFANPIVDPRLGVYILLATSPASVIGAIWRWGAK